MRTLRQEITLVKTREVGFINTGYQGMWSYNDWRARYLKDS